MSSTTTTTTTATTAAETITCSQCGQLVLTSDALTDDGLCAYCADVKRHTCDECGAYVDDLDSMTETVDGEHICPKCTEDTDTFALCDDCCGLFRIADGHTDVFGSALCENCYDTNGCNTCDECGRILSDSEGMYCEDNYQIYCDCCAERNLYCCDNCGEYHTIDYVYVDDYNNCICNHCFESCCYTICEDCGRILDEGEAFFDNENGCAYCESCFADHQPETGGIHDYGFKPTPVFHKGIYEQAEHPLFFGVELEQSHNNRSDLADNLEAFEETFGTDEDTWYLKHDSSLNFGFEMVSHPRTLASWRELELRISEYFEQARKFNIEGRDGLHVHISRAGMTAAHVVRFGSFIAAEQDNVVTIARRDSAEWAKYHEKPTTGHACRDCTNTRTRYQAVNWQNSRTVEVRVFRSTTNTREFYAAIEFCHAAYQFTKRQISLQQIIKGESWPLFLEFISRNDRYSHLTAFLKAAYGKEKSTYADYIHVLRLGWLNSKRLHHHKKQAA